jgi:hypothetical protein
VGFPQTDRNTVRRIPARGHYDKATVFSILDAGFLCHVAYCIDQQPFVIPTLYGRDGDHIYNRIERDDRPAADDRERFGEGSHGTSERRGRRLRSADLGRNRSATAALRRGPA